ncbi:hypothetical protein [Ensifer sp.]|jgi:hypothetical protein|uniref:hypothetical protein n=1 Tax=Ensifer sp. TaxID=1872086 RepID=UPI002E157E1A|nr:hypothetical protein [Ensifer sp.]
MREFWDRYGWLAGFVVIVGASLPFFFGRDAFCSSDPNEHCGREWVAASSGWLAVLAAFVSVIYLARQIDEANAQHREVLRTEAQAKIALCKRMPRLIGMIEGRLDAMAKNTATPLHPISALDVYFSDVDSLNTILSNPDYAEFDRLFQGDWDGIHKLQKSVANYLQWNHDLRKVPAGSDIASSLERMRSGLQNYQQYRAYCTHSREAALAFVKVWESVDSAPS